MKQKPKKLYVVEKDDDLAILLKEKFDNEIEIINDDILNISESKISDQKLSVFGNLPYNIQLKSYLSGYLILVQIFGSKASF